MIPRQRKNKDGLPETDMTFNEQPPNVAEAFPAANSYLLAPRSKLGSYFSFQHFSVSAFDFAAPATALAIDIAARLERLLASQATNPSLFVALKT